MNANDNKKGSISEISTSAEEMPFSSLIKRMLSVFPERSQNIVRHRFGLDGEKGKTLERIGEEFGITRERVRQIISDILRHIAKEGKNSDFSKLEERLILVIEKNDGIIKENDIVEKFNTDGLKEANAIRFIAQCSQKIIPVEKKGVVEKSWVVDEKVLADVEKIYGVSSGELEKEGKPIEEDDIIGKIADSVPGTSRGKALNFLNVFDSVKKNKFGKWGMSDWEEINPKGAREKIYLILKETGKPLHFTEIAQLIDKYGLGTRKAHPQTVHNELIKDDRFVLIGRGIYALREWGYSEGTIKDVLISILKDRNEPMSREELLKEVMKIRRVKKATVMINLNNAKYFERSDNLYSVKS